MNETTGAVTEKYVENSEILAEGSFEESEPDSPVVSGTEAEPRLYVNFEGLVEIPYAFSSASPPKQVYRENQVYDFYDTFERGAEVPEGGVLSASAGRIYTE